MESIKESMLDARIEKFKDHSFTLNQLRLEERCYTSIKKLIAQMLCDIILIKKEEPDKKKRAGYDDAYSCLFHTLQREVKYVQHCQGLMKKNDSHFMRKIYFEAVDKAVRQVRADVLYISTQ